jgi:hypothetical protein
MHGKLEMYTQFWLGNLKGKGHMGHLMKMGGYQNGFPRNV